MKTVLDYIRKAQWGWYYIAASHGAAFHAPFEAQRVLSDGMFNAKEADNTMNLLIDRKKLSGKFIMPDINTKEKAQKFIGLDIPAERAAKAKFLKTVVPEWIKKAKAQGTLVMN